MKKTTKYDNNSERYKKAKVAEAELNKRITETFTTTSKYNLKNLLGWAILLIIVLVPLILFIYVIWFFQIPIYYVLIVLVLSLLPGLCKCYGLIVAGFTIFSGIKLAFSGHYFAVLPVIPFTVFNPRISYFCLGWGLLVAGRQSRSKFGLFLGTLNLLGGAFGLFHFKSSTHIVAPGFWGSAISGILTVGLGCSMMTTILNSWSKSKSVEE